VRYQGYFAIVFTLASVAGPVLGGLVVSNLSWRWLFLVNLPLTAFAAWRLCKLPRGGALGQAGTDCLESFVLWNSQRTVDDFGRAHRCVSLARAPRAGNTSVLAVSALVWRERTRVAVSSVDLLRQKRSLPCPRRRCSPRACLMVADLPSTGASR
jgi:MFS family permease